MMKKSTKERLRGAGRIAVGVGSMVASVAVSVATGRKGNPAVTAMSAKNNIDKGKKHLTNANMLSLNEYISPFEIGDITCSEILKLSPDIGTTYTVNGIEYVGYQKFAVFNSKRKTILNPDFPKCSVLTYGVDVYDREVVKLVRNSLCKDKKDTRTLESLMLFFFHNEGSIHGLFVIQESGYKIKKMWLFCNVGGFSSRFSQLLKDAGLPV